MDGRDRACRLLAGFLVGDLDPAEARRWDEHLLECEACWRAVREDRAGRLAAQVLRRPAPPGLADRVVFAVEVAAAGRAAAPRRTRPAARSPRWARSGGRLRWPRLAGAGTVAVAVLVTLVVVLLPGGHQARSVPAAVAAVADYAQAIPPPARDQHHVSGGRAAPVEVGHPVTVTAGGQTIVLRTWRVSGIEAVVAVSSKPFPMPARAQGVAGSGMAWSARLGKLGLYCLNGRTSELVAAPVPAAELATLATRLPPA
jgi:hypothetical protein